MTLFFLNKNFQNQLGKRFDAHPTQAANLAEVIVIVDKNDHWITSKDRLEPRGLTVHPRRRAELIDEYLCIVRPTNGESEEI